MFFFCVGNIKIEVDILSAKKEVQKKKNQIDIGPISEYNGIIPFPAKTV